MPKKPEPKPVKVWRIINSYTGEPNSPHNYWTKPPLKAGEIAVRCRIVPEASYRKLKRLEKLCRELVRARKDETPQGDGEWDLPELFDAAEAIAMVVTEKRGVHDDIEVTVAPKETFDRHKRLEKLCRELVAEYKAGKSLINLVTRIKPIAAELERKGE